MTPAGKALCAIAALTATTLAQADYQLSNDRVTVICAEDVAMEYCQEITQRAMPLLEQAEALLDHNVGEVAVSVGNVSDFANGTATVLPGNIVNLYTSYPRRGALLSMNDWLNSVILHEMVHVVQLSQSSGLAHSVERVLGRHFFTIPNGLVPRWLAEGIAVWAESSVTDGRAVSPDYLGKLRMLSQAGLPRLQDLAINSAMPVEGDQYLIGSAFMRFITDQYGEQAVRNWVHGMGKMPIAGFYDTAYRNTFGQHMLADWQVFEQWLAKQANQELAAIGDPVAGELIAKGRIGAPRIGDNEQLWFVEDHIESARLLRSRDGIQQIELPAGVSDIQFRNNQWQALRMRDCGERLGSELIAFDGANWQVLEKCQGLVELVAGSNDLSIQFDGELYQLVNDSGESIPTPERTLSAAAWQNELVILVKDADTQEIYQRQQNSWRSLNVAELAPTSVAINGQDIYFISGVNGVDNIWRASDKQPVSRVTGGVTNIAASGETLWFRQLDPQWYALNELARATSVDSATLPSPVQTSANLDLSQSAPSREDFTSRPYRPVFAMRPVNWLPIVTNGVGASVNFSDALGQHNANIAARTDFDEFQLNLGYQLPNWSLAARFGQLITSTEETSQWQSSLGYGQSNDLGLGLISGYNFAAAINDNGYRLGAGTSLSKLTYGTYGVAPRKGASITGFASWGDTWRGQLATGLYRQVGPVYLSVEGFGIWDEAGEASLKNAASIGGVAPNMSQVSIAHPGITSFGEADAVWQQRNNIYWGSHYQPTGLGLSPIGINRFGASVGTLASGTSEHFAGSISAGVFADWALGFGMLMPIRTELLGLYGLENADWGIALDIKPAAF